MENPTKYYSNIQEEKVAEYLGWKTVSGSGARNFHKGDVVSDTWIGECKTHTEPNHKLVFDFQVWCKIKDEALAHFKNPVLIVDDGSQDLDRTWCMVELHRPQLFNEIQIEWDKRKSLYVFLSELNSLYVTCPYMFLVVNRDGQKFGIMPISEFKDYIERVK